jgi:hypothetical protein
LPDKETLVKVARDNKEHLPDEREVANFAYDNRDLLQK